MHYHILSQNDTLKELHAQPEGLSPSEVAKRQLHYGPNELKEKQKIPIWMLFLYQFKDFMILVLLAAAILSGIMGDITDTIIILIIVLLNAVIGFIQEFRAEKAMEALKKMAITQTQVLRNGMSAIIFSSEIVRGEIVIKDAVYVVPSDMRLLKKHSLRIVESFLIVESIPVYNNK